MAKAAKQAAVTETKRETRVYPLPEALPEHRQPAALAGGAWRVRRARGLRAGEAGNTNVEAGHMAVPLDADAQAECVRAHEMGHARWSPVRPSAELDPEIVQAVEDARIHVLLQAAGVGDSLAAGMLQKGQRDAFIAAVTAAGKVDVRSATLALVAAAGTGDEPPLRRAVEQAHAQANVQGLKVDAVQLYDAYTLSANAVQMLTDGGNAKPKFADTRRVCEWLESMLRTREEAERAARDAARNARDGAGSGASAFQKPKAGDVEPARNALAARPGMRASRGREDYSGGKVPGVSETAGAQWGTLRIEVPPMPLQLPRRVRAAKRGRPEAYGTVPKHWDRWCDDKRVFDAPKASRRGTVLVDFSGSMALSPEDVLAMLEAAPAATVACYDGDDRTGVLRVLARKGKRVRDELVCRYHGNNTVDGPALRWLAKQETPRIWVSDGGVTGVGEESTGALVRDAARICRVGGIVRVAHAVLVPGVLGVRRA